MTRDREYQAWSRLPFEYRGAAGGGGRHRITHRVRMTLMTQPTRHVIKKYANRKLYDTRTSRYVTLQGISELVRAGHDVQVIERDSGRDLTPLILSQIVTSEEKRTGADNGTTPQERGQTLIGYVRRTLSVPAALVSGE